MKWQDFIDKHLKDGEVARYCPPDSIKKTGRIAPRAFTLRKEERKDGEISAMWLQCAGGVTAHERLIAGASHLKRHMPGYCEAGVVVAMPVRDIKKLTNGGQTLYAKSKPTKRNARRAEDRNCCHSVIGGLLGTNDQSMVLLNLAHLASRSMRLPASYATELTD